MQRVLMGLALAGLFAMGCGHSKIWSQDGTGGILSLHGEEDSALKDARETMAAHCGPQGYDVERRDSVKVGQQSYHSSNTDYDEHEDSERDERRKSHVHGDDGNERGHSSSSSDEHRQTSGNVQFDSVAGVRDVFETRITYKCRPAL
jgi:hypothetical protein